MSVNEPLIAISIFLLARLACHGRMSVSLVWRKHAHHHLERAGESHPWVPNRRIRFRRFAQDRIEWAIAREGKDNLLSGALNDTGFLSLARALLTQFGSITDLHRQFVKHLAMQRMCYKLS